MFVLLFWSVKVSGQPYPTEEVSFKNGEVTLSGTLSFPTGKGPFPALLLISGSGPQDRDCNLMGFKMFEIMADFLNGQGFAVLRYDERGVGKSSGPNVMMSTSQDLANDASAAIDMLETDGRIDKSSIGILGHSEGGAIAPMVSTSNNAVDFIILLAGYGVPGKEIAATQIRKTLEADTTLNQQYIDSMVKNNDELIALCFDEDISDEERLSRGSELIRRNFAFMTEKQLSGIANREVYTEAQVKAAFSQLAVPWMRFYIQYDPGPTLEQVDIPVLLLFGSKDQQVTVEQNMDVMVSALTNGGNDNVTVKVFENANHLFQNAITGSPMEYFSLKKEFIPELLPFITKWTMERVK